MDDKILKYIWSQLTDTDKFEIDIAIDKSWHNHTSFAIEGDEILNKFVDLLEEYGQDNDLPECWWLEYGDEEEWLFAMLDKNKQNG